jgi:predicted transglutaminase-like cysteine proteinase
VHSFLVGVKMARVILLLVVVATCAPATRNYQADISDFPAWHAMVERYHAQAGQPTAEWRALVAKAREASIGAKLQLAQELNEKPYVQHDGWATPFEFLARGGMCRDYAVAKYWLLRESGVPASQLKVVVVRDAVRQADHAVLTVQTYGRTVMLDLDGEPDGAGLPRRYRPYYSINENGWWYELGLAARN